MIIDFNILWPVAAIVFASYGLGYLRGYEMGSHPKDKE